jgi:glycerophosphoryl diester phosphodiesterase
MPTPTFDLQGHRGARGLKPENTLPSFEVAIDLGVTTIETDVHLTSDGVPVLFHDAWISEQLCELVPGISSPYPIPHILISTLTLSDLRRYSARRNPDPKRFPTQDAEVTPLARLFAEQRSLDPFTPPTLDELFAFARFYADPDGTIRLKTAAQKENARRLRFDLELKRVPFRPEEIGDAFDGTRLGLLEQRVAESVQRAGVAGRVIVRSFDHRCVKAIRILLPQITTAVLLAGTAPVDPVQLVRQAEAQVYCPDFEFLDELQVRQLHDAGLTVVPWTVNAPVHVARLLAWGVDGVTTDYPDQMARLLDQGEIRV